VAAYGFNEGSGSAVADSSGSGNTGTLTSTTWSSAGEYGGALSFNGNSSWVTVADAASLDLTNQMTLEAWVDPNQLGSSWRTVIVKQQTGGRVYGLYGGTPSTVPGAVVNPGAEIQLLGTSALPRNTWTHLAATWDGSTLRLYVNGTLAASRAATGTLPNSTGPLRIGGTSVAKQFFKGLIDEVRVYNRALGQAEIQADMTTPVK
jgi:hypothetical protein